MTDTPTFPKKPLMALYILYSDAPGTESQLISILFDELGSAEDPTKK